MAKREIKWRSERLNGELRDKTAKRKITAKREIKWRSERLNGELRDKTAKREMRRRAVG